MLNALKTDPNHMHKRLGDGYYEQKLVNEQINRLTGYRRLDGYTNDEDQFKALMQNGITAAQELGLSLGVSLSAQQVARLTSDIVWLEAQTVTLPDGSTQTVFVPKVYVVARKGDLDVSGSLMSADKINLNIANGTLKNSGTIGARQIVTINAKDIEHSGHLQADKIGLQATDSIDFNGGTAVAGSLFHAHANNINLNSTTSTSGDKRNGNTIIDRVAAVYVQGDTQGNGVLSLQANHDLNLRAAHLNNTASNGTTQLLAQNNLNVDTVRTENHESYGALSDKNHRHVHQTAEIGSEIQTQGNVVMMAGNDLNIRQGEINSTNGTVALSAKNNVAIQEGRKTLDMDVSVYSKSRGILSSTKSLDQFQLNHDEAVGSTITGKQVSISAGKDVAIRGSNVISDDGTQIEAAENVSLTAAQNHYRDDEFHQTKKSGLMSAGIGFTIGSKKTTHDQDHTSLTHTASTIGSLKGDTTIIAGKQYTQIGSTVSSPEGNNTIHAQSIDIQAAHNQLNSNTTQTYEQKGLTVAFSSPVTDLAQQAIAVAQSSKQVGQSKNGRVNAMAAANAGWQAYQTGKSAQNLANGTTNANQVSISITYGEQKNQQTTQIQANQAQASQIQAGGKTTLIATGAAEQSNINITGSDVAGKAGTTLIADNDITLQSAEQSSSERSNNKSSGWNAGVAVSFGQGGWSLGITAGGNVGKGYGNGDSITHRHSHIGDKGSQTIIQSGGDTTLKGAQVHGKGVQVHAKNLSIQSVQDSETYRSKQQNAGAQVTVGYGFSAGGNYSQSKINADHQSVSEQSGIYAGDDGYQVNVKQHTQLDGGIITSTQSAEGKGKNRFSTATLAHSDIQNHSQYKGESFGIGASVAVSGKTLGQGEQNHPQESHLKTVADKNAASSSMGYGNDSDSQSSITRSGINTQNIRITDEAKQIELTGKTAEESKAQIHTDTTTDTAQALSGSLKNVFDKDKVQSELDLQVQVTKEFGTVAPNLVANASEKLGNVSEYETAALIKADAEKTLAQTSDETERTKLVQIIQQADEYLATNKTTYETWKEGGIGRALFQSGVGGLMTGNVNGALAGGSTSLAAPYLNEAEEKLGSTGTLINALGGVAIGYAVGGNAGSTAVGANVDWHNRQLHDSEIRKIKNIAAQFAKEQNITEQQATDRLMREAMRLVDKEYADKYSRDDTVAQAFLRKNTGSFVADGKRFTEFANMGYYNDPSKFAEQHGYSTERRRLYQQPVYTSSQKSAEINAQVWSTIRQGVGKGTANTPSTLLNAPINWTNEFTHGKFGTIPNVPYIYDYNNEVEAAIGQQTSGGIINVGSVITGVKANTSIISKSQSIPIVFRDGYYETAGMKISERYYNRLWQEGRPAPFVQAREILRSNPRILPDSKPGFLRYESLGLELIYNPKTGEIWHIQPQRRGRE
ncbi:hemagglutinin repeat-containing protein [Neisseriaceae bacterium CCUG 44465]|nr:hemagglutinin repeat-containing protein [Wielerella bovis]MCG7656599.1 hemagglutinin repeat-containing protein [Wielerella bovis]MCG7658824.1 hemagglutinin repeat-containing protein [Wielerella bovis]